MMKHRSRILVGIVLGAVLGTGCGGCEGKSIVPSAQAAVPGHAISLFAIAQAALDCPNGLISWTMVEQGGGSIDTNGVYTAPSCGSFTAGTFHVSASGCGRSVQIPIIISDPATAITIVCGQVHPATCCTPPPVPIQPGGRVQFYARVDYSCPNHVSFEPSAPPTTCR